MVDDEHSKESQSQSEQVLPVGPLEVPGRQPSPSLHHPQPLVPVQLLQSVPVHVAVPPPQELEYQSQSLQEPLSGPELVPTWQPPLPSAHQPHG